MVEAVAAFELKNLRDEKNCLFWYQRRVGVLY